MGSILALDSCEKNCSAESRGSVFSGCSGFLPQGKLTGWVRINTVRKVISQIEISHIEILNLNFHFSILETEDRVFDLIKHSIVEYHDDPDSQYIMDEIQKKFECCGAYTFNDWNHNPYFKCSSGDVLACGVPFSCCKTVSDLGMTQDLSYELSYKPRD